MCSALFERVFTWFYGDAGGSVLSLPELNWRYAIRRRVGGNAGFYLGLSLIVCAVVCLVVRMRSVSAPDECMSVFLYELELPPVKFCLFLIICSEELSRGQTVCFLLAVVRNSPEVTNARFEEVPGVG